MARLMIFTPTWTTQTGNAILGQCAEAIQAQIVAGGGFEWVIGLDNPFPMPDHRNVLAQYQKAREIFLADGYEALLTVEHDNVLPDPGAAQRMLDTDADVVYAPYVLRHGLYELSTWQYINDHKLGRSLTYCSADLLQAREAKAWRVCGVGFGCTLFRRSALEKLEFHKGEGKQWCPDLPFAADALKAGLVSMGRFDVPVPHIEGNRTMKPFPAPGEDGDKFWIGTWKGFTKWRCSRCAFSTLRGEGPLRAHFEAVHA